MSDKYKCYQCGRTQPAIAEDPEWVVCGHCGSRIMSAQEFRVANEQAEEERVKRALGFYDFKPPKN